MTWVRLDDGFTEHPKVAALDPVEFAFHVYGMVYCGRNLTDGFVPRRIAHTLMDLTGMADLGPPNPEALAGAIYEYSGPDVAARLVECGVWDEVEGGYQIHDFLDYNPTRAQVEEEREKKQAAGRAGGKAAAKARAQAKRVAPAQAESKPVPVPEPVPVPLTKADLRSVPGNSLQPTEDEIYLAAKLGDAITPGVIVNLHKRYGVSEVIEVLRSLADFAGDMDDPVAYVTGTLKARQEAM